MNKDKLFAGSLAETLDDFVRQSLEQSDSMPVIELAEFSGNEDDWWKADGAIFLRLKRTMALSADGEPYEVVARLFAPGGLWRIPREVTEMLVLIPPVINTQPGTGWAIWGAQIPPEKLAADKAYWDIDDETGLVAKAKYHAFKSALNTVFGTNKEDSGFQVTLPNGTKFVITEEAIELSVCDPKVEGQPGTIKSSIRIDREKVVLTAGAAAVCIDKDGQFQSIGSGPFLASHPGGTLGGFNASAFVGVVTAPGPATPSTSWRIAAL